MAKGDQFWLPKLIRPNRFWQQKWSGGTNFGKLFCQNQSGQTEFKGDRFWRDRPNWQRETSFGRQNCPVGPILAAEVVGGGAIALSILQAKNAMKLIVGDAITGVHFCVNILQPPYTPVHFGYFVNGYGYEIVPYILRNLYG